MCLTKWLTLSISIILFVYEVIQSIKNRRIEVSHIKHCFCSLQFNKAHTIEMVKKMLTFFVFTES